MYCKLHNRRAKLTHLSETFISDFLNNTRTRYDKNSTRLYIDITRFHDRKPYIIFRLLGKIEIKIFQFEIPLKKEEKKKTFVVPMFCTSLRSLERNWNYVVDRHIIFYDDITIIYTYDEIELYDTKLLHRAVRSYYNVLSWYKPIYNFTRTADIITL